MKQSGPKTKPRTIKTIFIFIYLLFCFFVDVIVYFAFPAKGFQAARSAAAAGA